MKSSMKLSIFGQRGCLGLRVNIENGWSFTNMFQNSLNFKIHWKYTLTMFTGCLYILQSVSPLSWWNRVHCIWPFH